MPCSHRRSWAYIGRPVPPHRDFHTDDACTARSFLPLLGWGVLPSGCFGIPHPHRVDFSGDPLLQDVPVVEQVQSPPHNEVGLLVQARCRKSRCRHSGGCDCIGPLPPPVTPCSLQCGSSRTWALRIQPDRLPARICRFYTPGLYAQP